MSSRKLSALLVDDERLARAELRRLLAAHPEIEVVGEAQDVAEARSALGRLAPELIFLDVQMPGGSGFDLVADVPESCRIVFVTAYSEHALRAFDVNALDYLLKPVPPARLAETVARVLRDEPRPLPAATQLDGEDPLLVAQGGHYRVVKVKDVVCLTAARDVSELHTADGRVAAVSRSLKDWEAVLPKRQFLRIHRSTIVNLDHIEKLEPWFQAGFRVTLRGHKEPLEVSRRFASLLRERILT